tara:strand:- start:400 stop:894 length:495 start_codon:yes stop_codon:yes gene_type:complete
MELNLDFLYERAKALKNFGKKEDELIKVKDTEVTELKDDDKETDVATKAVIETSGDAKEAEEVYQKDEGIITTKDKKEKDTEESLEEKLENIEKVIDTFSGKGTTVVDSDQSVGQASSINLNQQGLDLGTTQAKKYQAEYLQPSTVHDDRIALLYDNLKKYNLI